jgi:hypothetical protein
MALVSHDDPAPPVAVFSPRPGGGYSSLLWVIGAAFGAIPVTALLVIVLLPVLLRASAVYQ